MKMIGIAFILVLLLAQVGSSASANYPLAWLQTKLRVEPVSPLTLRRLAGKYSDPTREFAPGLSGDDLYLFPDGTYLYDEWADIEPLTINDKGRWQVEDEVIVLSSDQDITWTPAWTTDTSRFVAQTTQARFFS